MMSPKSASLLGILLGLAPGGSAEPALAQTWTVDAIRYATIRSFPVSGLVVGAPRGERMDVAMVLRLLRDGERVVLFDAGFHRPRWFESFEVADCGRPDSAVALAGVDPAAVTGVIVSHAHWDHMGGIDLFPNATLWIQRQEYDYYTGAARQEGGRRGGIDAEDIAEPVRRNTPGRVRFVAGDDAAILPGIRAFSRAPATRTPRSTSVSRGTDRGYWRRTTAICTGISSRPGRARPSSPATVSPTSRRSGG